MPKPKLSWARVWLWETIATQSAKLVHSWVSPLWFQALQLLTEAKGSSDLMVFLHVSACCCCCSGQEDTCMGKTHHYEWCSIHTFFLFHFIHFHRVKNWCSPYRCRLRRPWTVQCADPRDNLHRVASVQDWGAQLYLHDRVKRCSVHTTILVLSYV